jgi:hypothetical protein
MRAPLARSFAAVALLAGAACGGDDGGTQQAYADAWAATLTDDDNGFSVTEDEAECMSTAMMDELGAELFEKAEVEPADIRGDSDSPGEVLGAGVISDAQADAILDEWEGCADLASSLAEAAVGEFGLADGIAGQRPGGGHRATARRQREPERRTGPLRGPVDARHDRRRAAHRAGRG